MDLDAGDRELQRAGHGWKAGDAVADLSVIIVNWNSCEYLKKCLRALRENKGGLQVETIVVDNASQDNSERMVREQFPEVVFLQSGHNLGFSRANNLGQKNSTGDILLFLNPDTEVAGDAITDMAAYLRSQPSVGAVGARILNTDGSFQDSCIQPFPTIWNQLWDSALLRHLFPRWKLWGMRPGFSASGQAADVDAISGACFMIRKSVFEEVGGFGQDYFMYADDLDLSYKICKAGYAVRYLDDCRVIHHRGQSSAKQNLHFEVLHQRESLAKFFCSTKGRCYSETYRYAMGLMAAIRTLAILILIACGKTALQGKAIGSVLQKWVTVLQWAIGRPVHKTEPGAGC